MTTTGITAVPLEETARLPDAYSPWEWASKLNSQMPRTVGKLITESVYRIFFACHAAENLAETPSSRFSDGSEHSNPFSMGTRTPISLVERDYSRN
jgi:hypothetical protein